MADGNAVTMTGIRKSFGSVEVLHGVDFAVSDGEIHALIGGNGAGKSTLMKILQGAYIKDAGEIRLDGNLIEPRSSADARAAGIGMVFQEFSLIPTLTVAQNIYLGREPRRGGTIDDAAMQRDTGALMAELNVDIDPTAMVEDLSTAQWQLVEIAKAMSAKPHVLIMDEPTASLASGEVATLFSLLRHLKDSGTAIVYISHRMDEISRIADRVTVLRNGSVLWTRPISELTPAEIVEAVAGHEVEASGNARQRGAGGEEILAVRSLVAHGVGPVDIDIAAGEVVGLVGLMGSGRTALLTALFGRNVISQGTVALHGKTVGLESPSSAIAAGITLVPEDRRLQGLILEHSVNDNLVLPRLAEFRSRGLLMARAMVEAAAQLIARWGIQVAQPQAEAKLLSGGNQQKIVLAKWIGIKPTVFLLDEPTAGVDIGSKSQIIAMVREIAAGGAAVLVASSEFAELRAMCDRFLVLHQGTVVKQMTADDVASDVDLELAAQGIEQ